ncbi:Alkylphosphonate ABC transporter, ATP-binding component [Mycoplasmopsis edwardii]|uniref:Alkylphosphonate ABC transporter, ATP-binding component n=1 Tax=Mycoplasmopsis edwardii TaxID=53558 RepID=A0A3B0Q9W7_9BACT|nr:ATP-binding cassette domain-containing protein [Mycoplasmopsis edwardii]SYV96853.1 Alkylphosphonate ABC transporter, ATP-binding component [Mycoplasmopsis edwardii]
MKFKNANIGYNKEVVLKNVNLELFKGQINGIIGKSGCGKSTLLKAIFDKEMLIDGEIIFDNVSIKQASKSLLKKFKNKIYYLRPDHNLLEFTDFYQNILISYPHYKNMFYKFFRILTKHQRIELFYLLKEFNVEDLAFEKISNLSSGQKQRLSIVQMLFNKPEIILADEPTSNLDILNSKHVFEILNRYKSDKIIFIAIHDLSSAYHFDRLFTFDRVNDGVFEIPSNEFDIESLGKYYYDI